MDERLRFVARLGIAVTRQSAPREPDRAQRCARYASIAIHNSRRLR